MILYKMEWIFRLNLFGYRPNRYNDSIRRVTNAHRKLADMCCYSATTDQRPALGGLQAFGFVTVPHPPIQPAHEFLDVETQPGHVQRAFRRCVAADTVAIRHVQHVFVQLGCGFRIHSPVRYVDGAGDVPLRVRFGRPRVHHDDVLAQGDGLPQVIGIGLVFQLVHVVCDLVFHAVSCQCGLLVYLSKKPGKIPILSVQFKPKTYWLGMAFIVKLRRQLLIMTLPKNIYRFCFV